MEIYPYKNKLFNKSSSFHISLYNRNPFSFTNKLTKNQSKSLNISNNFSINNISIKKNNITAKKTFNKSNTTLINLPDIENNENFNKKILYNLNVINHNKTRNLRMENKYNLNTNISNPKGSLLFFDSSLKELYENNKFLKNNINYQRERFRKKNELYFDYDEKNYDLKHNSFSGNNPNLLKKKVMFVKNIFDYIYPKIIINRMKCIDKKERGEIKYKVNSLTQKFKNKYYINRYKSPEENSAFSKYNLKGAVHDEGIKQKGNFIKLKKILINGRAMIQLAKNYDYINN